MTLLEKFARTLKLAAMVSAALFIFVGCDCIKDTPKLRDIFQENYSFVGTWELIDGDVLKTQITFYENNTYGNWMMFIDSSFGSNHPNLNTWQPWGDDEYRVFKTWKVYNDTLFFTDMIDGRTGRSPDYTYNFNDEENLLYVKLVRYPYIGCGPYTMELIAPLGVVNGTFKRVE